MKDGATDIPLVELGTATGDTKGPWGPIVDQRFGMATPGLADD